MSFARALPGLYLLLAAHAFADQAPPMSCKAATAPGFEICTGDGEPKACATYPAGWRGCCDVRGGKCKFYEPPPRTIASKPKAEAPAEKPKAAAADEDGPSVQASMINN